MKPSTMLRATKAAHTIVWAFYACAICAIWAFAAVGNLLGAAWAIAIFPVEVAILVLNRGRRPLGGIVEHDTEDRAANFDIYRPAWLAGRTRTSFRSLIGGGVSLAATRWVTAAS